MTQGSQNPPSVSSQQAAESYNGDANAKFVVISLWLLLLLTGVLYVWLVVGDGVPLAALGLLGVIWIVHLLVSRGWQTRTPMDLPILGLLISLPVNLIISADSPSSWIRILHILLSLSMYFILVRLVQFRRHLMVLMLCLVALALGTALLGLIATDWQSTGVLRFLGPVYERLPHLSAVLTGASINKNTMGGALTFLPPLILSFLWDVTAFEKLVAKFHRIRSFHVPLYTLLLLLTFVLLIGVLFLTQSRGAWLGAAVGLFVFLVWKDKRFLWVIPFALIVLVVLLYDPRVGGLSGLIFLLDRGQDASLQGRLDIWTRVISLIRDFSAVGVGLDALNPVYQTFFNPFLFSEPVAALHHAHNTLLAVTIEMGIPALILYVSLLSSFGMMARRAWKHARTVNRSIIAGLVCGIISHVVFGLMDAFPLGKTLGITMWIYFGVMSALFVHRDQMIHSRPSLPLRTSASGAGEQAFQVAIGLAAWLILSLIAISLCQLNIYLGLGFSLAAGVVFGAKLPTVR